MVGEDQQQVPHVPRRLGATQQPWKENGWDCNAFRKESWWERDLNAFRKES